MKNTGLVTLVGIAGLMLFNWVVNVGVTGLRWDLTENKLYTLSEGSRAIIENLGKDIELTLYLSEETTRELPALRTYARRVQELLREFEALSAGKLTLQVVDPKPFSEEEDEATVAGLQAIPVGAAADSLFFGLVGRVKESGAGQAEGSNDETPLPVKEEVIAFFQPDKEQYLEYNVSQLIFNLNREAPPLVGILSGLNINGGVDMLRQTRQPAWMFMQFVEDLFDVQLIDTAATEIADDIDVLLLIHPRDLSEQTLLAIDQFALAGGRVAVFTDPVAELDQAMAMVPGAGPGSSDLAPLLTAWGLTMQPESVLGDYRNSLVVGVGPQRQPTRHIGMLAMPQSAFASDDIILAGLESINFSTTGILEPVEKPTSTITPLILSSPESNVLTADQFASLSDPEVLLKDFVPSGEQYMLAARIEGTATTAFPDGIEVEVEGEPAADEAGAEISDDASERSEAGDTSGSVDEVLTVPGDNSAEAKTGDQAAGEAGDESTRTMRKIVPAVKSTDNLNVIVVADTDVLSDRLWVQVQEFFGQRIASPWANNGDLLVNILDNLSGNADLINIRSRGRYSRPFTVVEDLRRDAELKFADQQQELEASLQETERQLSELQQLRQGDEKALLSEEQEQALRQFQQEKLKIRKALRDVQRSLDENIEALGARLKLVNIGLVPVVLTVIVILTTLMKRRRTIR